MVPLGYLSCLVLCAIVGPSDLAPAESGRKQMTDEAEGFLKYLQFTHGSEFKSLIDDINAELDARHITCVTQHGPNWFFYQELECRFCGDVCSPDTKTDECIKYCSSYWEAVAQNNTLQTQERKIEDLKENVEEYERISIASIVIAVLGLLAICALMIFNKNWFTKKYKGLVDTFLKKTDIADADRKGYHTVPVQRQATGDNETNTNAPHIQGDSRESLVHQDIHH